MKKLVAVFAAAAFGAAAAAVSLAPDAPLIQDGAVKVDVQDLDAFMLRVPEKMRAPFRASYDRVASIVDSIYVTRVAANKAREEGLDKDPAVQRRLQQVQEQYLAELYLERLQKEADTVNLDKRARELYDANPAKFTQAEQVYVQQILVGLNGRTIDMARQRAEQVYREATSGKEDFLQLAAKYTDDPDRERNGGDIGYYSLGHFPDPVGKAIAKLSKKGEITEPIEANSGFYILKFINRKPPQVARFEDVKQGILAEDRDRLRKEKVDAFVNGVRGSKSVVVNTDNVQAYVAATTDARVLEKELERASQAPVAKSPAAQK